MKQIDVYSLNELPAHVQVRALEHLAEEHHFDYTGIEDILDYWTDRLEALGFEDAKVLFSHSCSQCDGASFISSNINMDTVINNLILCEQKYERARELVSAHKLATDTRYPIMGGITSTQSRYSHEYSVKLDIYFLPCCHPLEECKKLYRLRDVLENSIEQYRVSLCYAIYKDIVAEYEYHYSTENLSELATVDNLYFHEDGTIYKGEVL